MNIDIRIKVYWSSLRDIDIRIKVLVKSGTPEMLYVELRA